MTRKSYKPWPTWPKPNHQPSIPAYLAPEYRTYWNQWYGRMNRARREAQDA